MSTKGRVRGAVSLKARITEIVLFIKGNNMYRWWFVLKVRYMLWKMDRLEKKVLGESITSTMRKRDETRGVK